MLVTSEEARAQIAQHYELVPDKLAGIVILTGEMIRVIGAPELARYLQEFTLEDPEITVESLDYNQMPEATDVRTVYLVSENEYAPFAPIQIDGRKILIITEGKIQGRLLPSRRAGSGSNS